MTTNMESDHRNEFCWVLEVRVLRETPAGNILGL